MHEWIKETDRDSLVDSKYIDSVQLYSSNWMRIFKGIPIKSYKELRKHAFG